MKKILCSFAVFLAVIFHAQEQTTAEIDTTKVWSVVGQNTLMLNQAAFSLTG